jgi:hypothetical protein
MRVPLLATGLLSSEREVTFGRNPGEYVERTAVPTAAKVRALGLTTAVKWCSSDITVATISNTSGSQGLVKTVAAGQTKITATDSSGVSGSTTLTVS